MEGAKLFPCRDKIPLTPNGFYDASNDIHQLTRWDEEFPGCQWGTPCGSESGYFVLDVDAKYGGLDTLASLEVALSFSRDETYSVRTPGGGVHLYFSWPATDSGALRNRVGIAPGLDIRGQGGYVIVPPSQGYVPANTHAISPCPPALLAYIREKTRRPEPKAGGAQAPEIVLAGGRNNYLTQVAGRLRRLGFEEATVLAALRAENEQKCDPPLEDYEVARTASSVCRYDPSDPIALSEGEPLYVQAKDTLEESKAFLGNKDALAGTPTGIPSIDALLGGGKRLGELTVWHAEAKSGKNTLWHFMMHLWLARENPVRIGYASRELSPATEVMPALLSLEAKRNLLKSKDLEGAFWEKSAAWPLYFSRGYGTMPLAEVEAWVRQLHAKGVEHFFFDHLHYLLEDSENYAEASQFSRKLKALTKELKVHIDLIVQPTKLIDGQSMGKNTLRGGAGIGQALDNLFVLRRVLDENNRKLDVLHVKLADKRFLLAKEGDAYLQYDQETLSFMEVEWEPISGPSTGHFVGEQECVNGRVLLPNTRAPWSPQRSIS